MPAPNGLVRFLHSAFAATMASLSGGRSFATLVRHADHARDRQDWEAAAAAYRAALDRRPKAEGLWVQLGNMCKEAGRYDRAKEAYDEALRRGAGDADLHLQIGHLLKVTGDRSAAQASYERALALDPGHAQAAAELRDGFAVPEGPEDGRAHEGAARPPSLNARVVRLRSDLESLLAPGEAGVADAESTAIAQARPALAAAVAALERLLHEANGLDPLPGGDAGRSDQRADLVFDVSDLMHYVRQHRLPTGIQRVQIEVISRAILRATDRRGIRVCCFVEALNGWRPIAADAFLTVCELSLTDPRAQAPEWRAAVDAVMAGGPAAPRFAFAEGSILINLGSSWTLQNYFLSLREAKRRHRIVYIPFVHDMIPVIVPAFCADGLVREFVGWARGLYRHADYIIVNSEATRRDVMRVGAALGRVVDDARIKTVTLDADYRRSTTADDGGRTLAKHGLAQHRFVLFVSSIEKRKNHLAMLDAWLALATRHGVEATPRLVCVSSRAGEDVALHAKLAAHASLRETVLILTGVPDHELAFLYRHCLFTVYPSLYEGWGLPITESLSYGKTAVVTRTSSLTEAGGDFVDYVTPGDAAGLVRSLDRLIGDRAYREEREQAIRTRFMARSWDTIATEIVGYGLGAARDGSPSPGIPSIEPGRYYSFACNGETALYALAQSGEIFRAGEHWGSPAASGCWLKGSHARIEGAIEDPGLWVLSLGLRAGSQAEVGYAVVLDGQPARTGTLAPGQQAWVRLPVRTDGASLVVRVDVSAAGSQKQAPGSDPDAQPVRLGVIGLMLCAEDDRTALHRLAEAVATDRLADLARGDQPAVVFDALLPDDPAAPDEHPVVPGGPQPATAHGSAAD